MLDVKYIKDNIAEVTRQLKRRGISTDRIETVTSLDTERIALTREAEAIRQKKNEFSKNISTLSEAEKEKRLAELSDMSDEEKRLGTELGVTQSKLEKVLRTLPNIPSVDTPDGTSDKENVVIKECGNKPRFDFETRDYMTLAKKHHLIDTERAAKVSGSRFGYLVGDGAILWNALVQYTLQHILKAGFTPFYSPSLVREEIMRDTGYDSYLEGQEAYHLEKDNLYLVGTGEHALLPYHRDEILDSQSLPRKYSTYSSCYRREAGSYGKDTKGILRVHQFEKQELVVLTHPEKSWDMFDQLVQLQETIIQGLALPYHLLAVCAGDLPRPSARVVDLECWIPSEKTYRETHSASNCTDYQARLNNIRYKDASHTQYVHILNATAITPRTLIALLEHNQTSDGSIEIPPALHPYTFGLTRITS